MTVQFGTDGIRGVAGSEITTTLAFQLGWAVAKVFNAITVVGYDTRESSPALANAVMDGLFEGGVAPRNLGLITTPGVAVAAEFFGGAGVVVSASHNPYSDNGLKVFGMGGTKLDLETEAAVAAALNEAPLPTSLSTEPWPVDTVATDEYVERLLAGRAENLLDGLTVVLDCANGAASKLAPKVFRSLGATVHVIHDTPTGRNINEGCGSTHPEDLVRAVKEYDADLGLAFDGDADRLVAVDDEGQLRDGDDLMVLFALDLFARGELDTLVVTSMSNLGMRRALSEQGLTILETDVGDRHVLMALEAHDLPFGGEQSGHLIFRHDLPTGDGMWSGLRLCELVQAKGSLAALANAAWTRAPQMLLNIPRDEYDEAVVNDLIATHASATVATRVVVRPSGTEPVVRVMVESERGEIVDAVRDALRAQYPSAR